MQLNIKWVLKSESVTQENNLLLAVRGLVGVQVQVLTTQLLLELLCLLIQLIPM